MRHAKSEQRKVPVSYRLPPEAARRLAMHSASVGKSQSEILSGLILRHLPDYSRKGG